MEFHDKVGGAGNPEISIGIGSVGEGIGSIVNNKVLMKFAESPYGLIVAANHIFNLVGSQHSIII